MLGVIQRGDADIGFNVVRGDAMNDDSVRLGPTLASADTVILGTKLTNETSSPPFVTDVIYNVDLTTYLFCLVMLVMVVTILNTSQVVYYKLSTLNHVKRKLAEIMTTVHWKILELIVDQEDFRPSLLSGRFLWLHVCLAIFVLVFGYF